MAKPMFFRMLLKDLSGGKPLGYVEVMFEGVSSPLSASLLRVFQKVEREIRAEVAAGPAKRKPRKVVTR